MKCNSCLVLYSRIVLLLEDITEFLWYSHRYQRITQNINEPIHPTRTKQWRVLQFEIKEPESSCPASLYIVHEIIQAISYNPIYHWTNMSWNLYVSVGWCVAHSCTVNESLVENVNFYFLAPLSQILQMLHFDANPITIGYLVTELWRI